jgi:hypothetical protein
MKRSMFVSFMAEVRALRTSTRVSSFELAMGLDWAVTKTTPEQARAVESNAPSTVKSVTMLEW